MDRKMISPQNGSPVPRRWSDVEEEVLVRPVSSRQEFLTTAPVVDPMTGLVLAGWNSVLELHAA